jgi:hypothetical protein
MLKLRDRVNALHQDSTPEAHDAIDRYAFALHDAHILDELESGQKPLTHAQIIGAILRAADRHNRSKTHFSSEPKAQLAPVEAVPAVS